MSTKASPDPIERSPALRTIRLSSNDCREPKSSTPTSRSVDKTETRPARITPAVVERTLTSDDDSPATPFAVTLLVAGSNTPVAPTTFT